MRVLISGSHGLVGQALIGSLTNDGHEIHRLVRRGRAVGSSEIEWHPNQGLIDAEHLEGLDAVEDLGHQCFPDQKLLGGLHEVEHDAHGHLRIAEVSELDLQIEDGKVKAYRAKLRVSFKYEAD